MALPHPTNCPRDDHRRSGYLVWFRAGIFPLQGRPPAGVPQRADILRRRANTTPASATKPSGDIAREIVDKHLDLCLDAGINHEGINAEVAKGQWEFQIFGKGSKSAADDVGSRVISWLASVKIWRGSDSIANRSART